MDPVRNACRTLFTAQQDNRYRVAETSCAERLRKLKALRKALEVTYRDQIRVALMADLKKPPLETDLTEVYQVLREIKVARKQLRSWMADHHVGTPLALAGTTSWHVYEPKGACLVIAPWNFPLSLTFGPLVSAIAAGNTVILKPSEMTPNTAAVMADIVRELFPKEEVALIEGDAEVSKALLELPFNHVFFTGSPEVGKIVMKAAAEHLASVTLELGGKSPAIIDEGANFNAAAKKIAWGKFLNAGQVCVSPDYLLVHETCTEPLIQALKKHLRKFYTENASVSASYPRLVSQKHFDRLLSLRKDALDKGAQIVYGGNDNREEKYMEPTLMNHVPQEARLLQEEIFGPILPILSYSTREEMLTYINSRPTPLALYIYSRSRKSIHEILGKTRAGSTAINSNVLQYTNHYLPFGGSGYSGTGKSHGFYGFREFSNQRSVLKQNTWAAIELLFPPYNRLKEKIARFVVRWL